METKPDLAEEADKEIAAEVVPDDTDKFPWAIDDDERRRSFILVQLTNCTSANMGAHEIEGRVLVENMEMICRWLKDGTVPQGKSTKPLRVMSDTTKPPPISG